MADQEYARPGNRGQERTGGTPAAGGGPPGRKARHWPALPSGILVGALASLGACGTPDPPEDLVNALGATPIRAEAPAPGLAYFHLRNLQEPWSVHLLRIDLDRCELGLEVLEAPVPDGSRAGRTRVSELTAFSGEEVLAAVNGDFFTPEGLPVGTEVVGGEVRQVRNRPALAWHPGRAPWMGLPRPRTDSVLSLGWDLPRGSGDGATQVVGGFPLLLHEGHQVGDLEVASRPSFAAARHPRTAVGYDADGNQLWVMVVDGRQPGHSDGMTLPELTVALQAMGVEEALNLDGGGSTVMVLEGEAVSSPSDAQGERPVVNALAVRRDRALCRAGG